MTFVDLFGYALVSVKYAVGDSAVAGRTHNPADAFVQSGFRWHHLSADGETAYDLAREAVLAIEGDLGGIDTIVYATCIPANANLGTAERFAETADVKHLMDFPASRLQADLGFDRAFVVGLAQQGVHQHAGVTADRPRASRHRRLAVSHPVRGAGRFPPGATYEQAYSLISDGAAACVVSREPADYRLVASHHITNGAMVSADDDETVGSYFAYTHRVVPSGWPGPGSASTTSTGASWWSEPENDRADRHRSQAERRFAAGLPEPLRGHRVARGARAGPVVHVARARRPPVPRAR